MVITMKIGIIKTKTDTRFQYLKVFGANIIELDDPEKIDDTIKKLHQDNYSTILISNEIASFSSDIIRKYNKKENINIIIS